MGMSITTVPVDRPAPADNTARLYRDYAGRVRRWATRLTHSPSDADDIAQEVFLLVHRRAGAGQDVGSPSSWLLKVTFNVVRHHWRARGRAAKREESWDPAVVGPATPDPLQTLETQRSAEKLQAAIDTLTPRYRTIYLLCEIKGLPSTTVAEMTGLHPDTLRVRRYRARQQIARCLRANDQPGPLGGFPDCRIDADAA